jgi:hyperosmotically inducible protein
MLMSPTVPSGEVFSTKGGSSSTPQRRRERCLKQKKEEDGTIRPVRQFKAHAVVDMAGRILAGCSALTGHQSPSAAVSASAITTKVTIHLLADSTVGALAIDVDTTDGIVSLNGFVDNEQERRRAMQIAKSASGVKRVDAPKFVIRRS